MTSSNHLYLQGQQLAQQLFGNPLGDFANAPVERVDDLPKILTTWLFGYLLKERNKLDVKTKVLCLISMYTATDQTDMLEQWIPAARNAGCGHEEVQETIVTMVMYAGWPSARRALAVLADKWPLAAA